MLPNLRQCGINLAANTQTNELTVVGSTIDPATGVIKPRSAQNVALSIIHEEGHSGNIAHPFESWNTASDVALTPVTLKVNGKNIETLVPADGAQREKILSNVMMHTNTDFEGKTVKDFIKNANDLNRFSPEQTYILLQQIIRDTNEKNKSNKPSTESQNGDINQR